MSSVFRPLEGERTVGVCGAPHCSYVSLPAWAAQLIS